MQFLLSVFKFYIQKLLDIIKELERMKTGTYRRVCNHCKWLYYVKPSRERRILRELEARHRQT